MKIFVCVYLFIDVSLPSHILFVLKWSFQHVVLYPFPMSVSMLLDKETRGVCLFGCPEHICISKNCTREIQVKSLKSPCNLKLWCEHLKVYDVLLVHLCKLLIKLMMILIFD